MSREIIGYADFKRIMGIHWNISDFAGILAIENVLVFENLEGKLLTRTYGFRGIHVISQSYGVLYFGFYHGILLYCHATSMVCYVSLLHSNYPLVLLALFSLCAI